jgi:hypothetical protein
MIAHRVAKRLAYAACAAALFLSTGTVVRGQDKQAAAPAPELITRVYSVADLIVSAPNYPFEGIDTAGVRAGLSVRGSGVGGFGGGGGGFGAGGLSIPSGMGGFGGGLGGGMAMGGGGLRMGGGAAGAEAAAPARQMPSTTPMGITMDDLIEAITTSIAQESWEEVGGRGTTVSLGGRIVVSQTSEVHTKIEALLKGLRAEGGRSTVTVRALWLPLNAKQFEQLMAESPAKSPRVIHRAFLESLTTEVGGDQGEVTCFDGQTEHIISGSFRSAVTGVIPVVGQLDDADESQMAALDPSETNKNQSTAQTGPVTYLAQVAPATSGNLTLAQAVPEPAVGYQPVIGVQHSGAVLEVTPTRVPDAEAVVLDIRSVVTRWKEQAKAAVEFQGVIPLDRMDVVSQQLATTLRVPVGHAVLVGGMTLEPGAKAADSAERLYLIVEVIDSAQTQ